MCSCHCLDGPGSEESVGQINSASVASGAPDDIRSKQARSLGEERVQTEATGVSEEAWRVPSAGPAGSEPLPKLPPAEDHLSGINAVIEDNCMDAQGSGLVSVPHGDANGDGPPNQAEEEEAWPTMSDEEFFQKQMSNGSDVISEIGAWDMQYSVDTDESIAREAQKAAVETHASGHGHGPKPPSMITAGASALINYLLMFGLCCAYGMIMFVGDHNSRHVALGVKINLGTAFFTGMVLAGFSGIPVAIGGPDLNPVVFLGGFIDVIARSIAEQQGMIYPESGASASSGASGGSEFCSGYHYDTHAVECDTYHEELRATAIFAVVVSTSILGLAFFLTGTMRLTRFVQYMPTSISEAFLSCIGYKVFLYAMKFTDFDGRQFMPAAAIGVGLYFLKALHIGNPALVMPLGLLLPVGLFYVIMMSADPDFDPINNTEVMFPMIDDVPFYHLWLDGLGNYKAINWEAYSQTLADLVTMLVVVMLDCSLKIAATETKMPVKVYQDSEIKLYGASNILNVIFGSSVGYMQLKFNVIAYGVMNNVTDRRGGLMYALLCGVCFFFTLNHFNYLPRFFLSALLFFAGTGFVCENLWGSRKYLSRYEWMEVVSILVVFIATGQLLYAVLWGGLLCALAFVRKYAKLPPMEAAITGRDIYTPERRQPAVHSSLEHLCGHWLLVLRPKGYVFFGSAHAVSNYARDRVKEQEALPAFRRFRFLCLECALLEGMDASASRTFKKLAADMKKEFHVKVVWSGLSPALRGELKDRQVLAHDAVENKDWFMDIDRVVLHVEELALTYLQEMQEKWCRLHPSFAETHNLERERREFEPFNQVFLRRTSFLGAPWRYCEGVKLAALETVLWAPGDTVGAVFLVHTGAVALFEHEPTYLVGDDGSTRPIEAPIAVYRQGWFLNREGLARSPSRHFAVAIESGEALVWSRANWRLMSREAPLLTQEIMSAVMKQQSYEDSLTEGMVGHFKAHASQSNWGLMQNDSEELNGSEKAAQSLMGQNDSHGLASSANAFLRQISGGPAPHKDHGMDRQTSAGMGRQTSHSKETSHSKATNSVPRQISHGLARQISHTLRGVHASPEPYVSGGDVGKHGSMKFKAPPVEISTQLTALRTAQAISILGFWRESATGEREHLPPLSDSLKTELRIAFHTFASNESGSLRLPTGYLREALMYAGVAHGGLLEDDQLEVKSMKHFTEDEFLHIGHRALMASLSKESVEAVHGMFKRFSRRSGKLGTYELAEIFGQIFHTHVSEDEIENLTALWESTTSGMNFEDFLGLVSMFVRAHEQSRRMVDGLHSVMKGMKHHHIDPQPLFEEHGERCGLTLLEFREMCWAANWKNSEHAEYPDINTVAMAVLQFVEQPLGQLPPRPKFPPGHRNAAAKATDGPMIWHRHISPMFGEVEVKMIHEDDHSGEMEVVRNMSEEARDAKQAGGLSNAAALHIFLEYPESSRPATVWAGFMACLNVCFLLPVILHPIWHGALVDKTDEDDNDRLLWNEYGWEYMEAALTSVFTLEYLFRLYLAKSWGLKSRLAFMWKQSNVYDLVSVLPFWLELILSIFVDQDRFLPVVMLARFVRLVRCARIIRMSADKSLIIAPATVTAAVVLFIYFKMRQ